ncbi:T9SS type A sorting domain-containing protein [Flavobacterium sp.]|uniref:T9SS type A sorting domain-containing protein n=1 Tax=Flavobacterium sp. TaxID=239 RepID=UPI00286DB558|nr:T9SS type A sorting domain-containing protein [Flavobacterium sp.]
MARINNSVLSTNSFKKELEVSVYPNPSNGIFNIDTNATFQVIDMLGKQMITKKIEMGVLQIDLSNYSNGIYLMKITKESNQTKFVKLIKQ